MLRSFLLSIVLCFLTSAALSDTRVGRSVPAGGGFSELLNLQNNSAWGIVKSTEHPRAGKYAWRFEVRPGDCYKEDCEIFRERAELSARPFFSSRGKKWIAFSIYFSPNFHTVNNGRYIFGQIKAEDGPTGLDLEMKEKGQPGIVYFSARDGMYYFDIINLRGTTEKFRQVESKYPLASIKSMRGKWTDILLEIDFESKKQGAVVYVNGRETARHKGPFMQYRSKKLYFKFGDYRHMSITNGKPASGTFPTDIVFFDEVMIGDNKEDVDIRGNTNLGPVN